MGRGERSHCMYSPTPRLPSGSIENKDGDKKVYYYFLASMSFCISFLYRDLKLFLGFCFLLSWALQGNYPTWQLPWRAQLCLCGLVGLELRVVKSDVGHLCKAWVDDIAPRFGMWGACNLFCSQLEYISF